MATLYRIDSDYFCAGAVADDLSSNGRPVVIIAAPILKYAVGQSEKWFLSYCGRKGWEVVCVGYCMRGKRRKRSEYNFEGEG